MKQLNQSWLHYRQQFIGYFQTARDFVKTYHNPHAALFSGATVFVVWWVCNLLFLIENRLTCRLLLMIPGLYLYSLLFRKGDLFFVALYRSSFLRNVLLYGRRVEIVLYTSIPLSMLFFFSLCVAGGSPCDRVSGSRYSLGSEDSNSPLSCHSRCHRY